MNNMQFTVYNGAIEFYNANACWGRLVLLDTAGMVGRMRGREPTRHVSCPVGVREEAGPRWETTWSVQLFLYVEQRAGLRNGELTAIAEH